MSGDRATKMLILASARTLFSEKGYENTPVEEICTLAGVAKGSFFYYFTSKQYIVRYILASHMEEVRDKILGQIETFGDAMSKAEFFISAMIEQRDSKTEPQLYFKKDEPEWFKTVLEEERSQVLYPLFEQIVFEGIEQGLFKMKNPYVCSSIAYLGIDAFLKKSEQDDNSLKKGIREITAKTLGVREAALLI